jgi:hypothetical protein
MGWIWLPLVLISVLGQAPVAKGDGGAQQAVRNKREHLLELYASEAAGYTIYRDANRQERVELRREPVYVWTNPIRDDGQDGAVFVWTCRGRAEVLGCIFSAPATGPRKLYHEFHSLSPAVLDVQRAGSHAKNWTPLAPGIELATIALAPRPATSAPQRMAQMRVLTRDFSASTRDHQERRWELRMLSQPLYRYESTDPNVVDGALFSFVTSAGTDPEALLVLEARKTSGTDQQVWQYAVARFTDTELSVRHKGKEVFTAPLLPYNLPEQDPKHRYRVFHDRDIAAVEERAP